MVQPSEGEASKEGSKQRDETAALLLLAVAVAVIIGLAIAALLGSHIAFPQG